MLAVALVTGAVGFGGLALRLPLALLGLAALFAGLTAGLPFAPIFSAAQRAGRMPGGCGRVVNAWAIAAIVAGTPLLGLSFALPGDGRLGFAALAVLWAAALHGPAPQPSTTLQGV